MKVYRCDTHEQWFPWQNKPTSWLADSGTEYGLHSFVQISNLLINF